VHADVVIRAASAAATNLFVAFFILHIPFFSFSHLKSPQPFYGNAAGLVPAIPMQSKKF
jgi:hypothetical protein